LSETSSNNATENALDEFSISTEDRDHYAGGKIKRALHPTLSVCNLLRMKLQATYLFLIILAHYKKFSSLKSSSHYSGIAPVCKMDREPFCFVDMVSIL
jgi:hypothetical protein